MTQITTGIRSILSKPLIYKLSQTIAGGGLEARKLFVKQHFDITPGATILDIGCGPADILDCLPSANYYGFDISQEYVEFARRKYHGRGNFYVKHLTQDDLHALPKFDYVLCIGLLHHLTDDEVRETIALSKAALWEGGTLLTLDGCFEKGQSSIAKLMLLMDRGQNVRDKNGYDSLIRPFFDKYQSHVFHKKWLPYTYCITKSIL
jgi:cyclopropane fatty-acyl-phospholipid synthase-like methyltransferase